MNILITGGASGLGETITKQLAANQNNTIYFTFSKSEEKANNISKAHHNAKAIHCDFTSDSDINNLIDKMETFNLEVLINNANSGFEKKHFHKHDPADFIKGFNENVLPVIKITQKAISIFRKNKFGKIITVLSAALESPPIGWSEYVAAKAYLLALNKSWAVENKDFNITANCISPAFMQTGLTEDTDERIISEMVKNHPLKRILTATEVAEVVAFYVNSSQQINGTNFFINAGDI